MADCHPKLPLYQVLPCDGLAHRVLHLGSTKMLRQKLRRKRTEASLTGVLHMSSKGCFRLKVRQKKMGDRIASLTRMMRAIAHR